MNRTRPHLRLDRLYYVLTRFAPKISSNRSGSCNGRPLHDPLKIIRGSKQSAPAVVQSPPASWFWVHFVRSCVHIGDGKSVSHSSHCKISSAEHDITDDTKSIKRSKIDQCIYSSVCSTQKAHHHKNNKAWTWYDDHDFVTWGKGKALLWLHWWQLVIP